jgi:hypothetical protein
MPEVAGRSSSADWTHAVAQKAAELSAIAELPADALMPLIGMSGAVRTAPVSGNSEIPPDAFGQLSPLLRVVVRDDLLEPLSFFLKLTKGCAALSASTAALYVTGPNAISVGGIAAALADLYELFKKTWGLAHRLSEVEWAVISELSRLEKASTGQLASRLKGVSTEKVTAILKKFEVSESRPKNFTRLTGDTWELVEV